MNIKLYGIEITKRVTNKTCAAKFSKLLNKNNVATVKKS